MTVRSRPTTRRFRTAALVTAIAGALTFTGTPSVAEAAVPVTASKYAGLMRQSLTPSPAYVKLRDTLAAQRTALSARGAELVADRTTQATAQTRLTTAIETDAAARTRYAVALEGLTSAKNRRTAALQQRPRRAAAVTAAQTAVTAAADLVKTRRTEAQQAAGALRTAQSGSRAATTGLDASTTAWQAASAAVTTNQQKLIALDNSAELRSQAVALSREVVTQVRAGFTMTDATTVNGVTVHKSVAFAFRQMINDAKADGVVMSGGGFRTRQRQIELRKTNGCPDVYTAPASSCRVPTAIPGQSLHELGLAIDISAGGRTIGSNTPAFRWLSANAARYGFKNLPSEAWHWSITGG